MNATDTAPDFVDLDKEALGRQEVDQLYRIYQEKRIAAQVTFYESRMRENQLNSDFTFNVGALVMTISSLIATVSASGGSSYLTLISAILPAFAALLGSFRQLYGWERQTNIYRDSLLGLERVRLIAPDDDRMPAADLLTIYPQLVSSSEKVFTSEVNQWGQFIQEKEKGTEDETTDTAAMTALIGNLDLTDEQRAIIAAVLSGGGKGKSSTTNLLASVTSSTTVVASSTGAEVTVEHEDTPEVVEAFPVHDIETAAKDAQPTDSAKQVDQQRVSPTESTDDAEGDKSAG
jgi:hypothetical protein